MNTPSNTPTDAGPPTESRGERRRRWWLSGWFLTLLVLLIAAGSYYFFWKRPASAAGGTTAGAAPGGPAGAGGSRRFSGANGVSPVGVAVAKTTDIDVYLSGLGTVTPVATAVVKSRVDGTLVKLNFTEGQSVQQGQLLAELDPRPYEVAVTQAQGQLARDTALLNGARVDLQRYRVLVEQDSIQSQQLDTQAALVKQYEGTVKADQGNLDSARLQLLYSKVTAPIGGRIGLRQVDLGNVVHASDANGIATITQLQPITVVFSLPEDNIPAILKRLRDGGKPLTEAWDRDQKNKIASGALLTIDNQIDNTTGTVKLKAQFPNTDDALFPQQFVNVHMLLDVQRGVTAIPSAAVQRSATGQYVYVVKPDQTVTVRTVTTGPMQGDLAAISAGIAPGETVVVDGIDKLREGAKVEPVMRGGANDPALQHPKPGARRGGPGGRAAASAPADSAALSPEERQKRWEDLNRRIDAGEFGEDIKKLPEDQRRERMKTLRAQRQAAPASAAN
ncbi:MdtA/MuxA family multidrug efflux RND transporter periplasmic adaptor subunit [Variovorax terrae]|uniref:MdtA/MuxA family multidrug efflux RND transporter periplasmic adaptor subunit n=1 Tax=Variovorax terrae TaxID=2923278 RepID=A0A9X1VRU0_9BURK|nr:MdtA/MuxA family multidrug efflux RND transporter periplasmic adaptor subunit [Variovorax terrae]MCJ0761844.1 MdtA/MuxA family multidrug efflux RND transporter periplasmic adaptor subunit [Variovorax terrae]